MRAEASSLVIFTNHKTALGSMGGWGGGGGLLSMLVRTESILLVNINFVTSKQSKVT